MKYARVRGDKVMKMGVHHFPTALPVTIGWEQPTNYPREFYTASKLTYTVEETQVIENKDFLLKNVEEIKRFIYDIQEGISAEAASDSFEVDGEMITMKAVEDSRIRSDGHGSKGAKSIKIKKGKWMKFNGSKAKSKSNANANDVNKAYQDHVHTILELEESGNEEVALLTTHEELKAYYESMTQQ